MRKRENHYFMKLFIALVMSTLLVSCGQENESGKKRSSTNPFGINGGYSYTGFTSANGQNVSGLLTQVGNENPCQYSYQQAVANNNQRIRTVVPLTGVNVNAGAVHVGVTVEGDIAVVSRQNNAPVMEIYLCRRPGATGQGQMTRQPALNTSYYCPISEITAASVVLTSGTGQPYILEFFPIHVPNAGKYSQICQ